MALSVNWATKVILVPQADLTFLGGTLYELDVDAFRLELKEIEASEEGLPFLDTHRHNTEVVLSGDIYARIIEIINGYTVEFEDGQYVVKCVGANHNLADVKVPNQVSIVVGNSSGLIRAQIDSMETEVIKTRKYITNAQKVDISTQELIIYDDDGVTPLQTHDLDTDGGEDVTTHPGVQTIRGPGKL